MAREKLVFVSPGCGITHWDKLRPGLIILDEATPLQTIADQASRTQDERRTRARQARSLAAAWNDEVMDRWVDILEETVEQHAHNRQ